MKNVPVTSPLLPPLEDFIPYLREIWDSRQLTNCGPFHECFEHALAEYLGVKHVSLFANGTLALVTALQALRTTGEVITTPYTFVATAHALKWNGLQPVFVDIEPDGFNLDPDRIERAITPATTCIVPVHCYGIPCQMDRIERIADIYGLKVIYDAAHAFGVSERGQGILGRGDLSVLSFHATKVFNTFEGGAIISGDAKMKQRIDFLKNFGYSDEVTVVGPGINGKMNEVEAAFGMLQLKHIDNALAARADIFRQYKVAIEGIRGLRMLSIPPDLQWNYAYCPILVESGYARSREALYEDFRAHGILARRYFYPLVSSFPMYRGHASADCESLPNASAAAERVICLPIYPGMTGDDLARVIAVLEGRR